MIRLVSLSIFPVDVFCVIIFVMNGNDRAATAAIKWNIIDSVEQLEDSQIVHYHIVQTGVALEVRI